VHTSSSFLARAFASKCNDIEGRPVKEDEWEDELCIAARIFGLHTRLLGFGPSVSDLPRFVRCLFAALCSKHTKTIIVDLPRLGYGWVWTNKKPKPFFKLSTPNMDGQCP
jgi:hypothetical protein